MGHEEGIFNIACEMKKRTREDIYRLSELFFVVFGIVLEEFKIINAGMETLILILQWVIPVSQYLIPPSSAAVKTKNTP